MPNYKQLSDNDLILKAKAGDQAAFGDFVTRNEARLQRYILQIARKRMQDRHEAEDLAQITWLEFWNSLHKVQVDSHREPMQWAFGLSRTILRSYLNPRKGGYYYPGGEISFRSPRLKFSADEKEEVFRKRTKRQTFSEQAPNIFRDDAKTHLRRALANAHPTVEYFGQLSLVLVHGRDKAGTIGQSIGSRATTPFTKSRKEMANALLPVVSEEVFLWKVLNGVRMPQQAKERRMGVFNKPRKLKVKARAQRELARGSR